MSEIETKRTTELDAQKQQNKRADALEENEKKKDGEPALETSMLMPWDADVEGFLERAEMYVRDLRLSMGHTEFRSLVVTYRELSAMGRRAAGTRLQQKGLHALFRAVHAGDYEMYQHTWQEDARSFQRAARADTIDDGG